MTAVYNGLSLLARASCQHPPMHLHESPSGLYCRSRSSGPLILAPNAYSIIKSHSHYGPLLQIPIKKVRASSRVHREILGIMEGSWALHSR